MRTFEWIPFLIEHRVEYVERGPNVKRGEINIKCPFCGPRDTSHHLGIDYQDTGWFACWRSKTHSGTHPAKLIRALLDCSWKEAVRIAEKGQGGSGGSVEELQARLDGLGAVGGQDQGWERRLKPQKWPKEFFHLGRTDRRSRWSGRSRFLTYLWARGIVDHKAFAKEYHLHGCLSGRFKHRIIFPITFDGKLIGWTGRAIAPAKIKYDSFPSAEDSDAIDSVIWNYDRCATREGKFLIVTEGCFDAGNAEWVARDRIKGGVGAVATLGINPSSRKIQLIRRLMPKYETTFVVYDKEAEHRSVEVARALPGAIPAFVPGSFSDLGEISGKGLEGLLNSSS